MAGEPKCKCGHAREDHYRDPQNNLFCNFQFCHCKNYMPKDEQKQGDEANK